MMKNRIKLAVLITLISLSLFGTLENIDVENYFKDFEDLSTSAVTLSPFIIDNNGGTPSSITWAQAVTYSWCSGAGTKGNPYIIDNIAIDGLGTKDCLNIIDSSVYFIISNSIFYNSWSVGQGIRLNNVNNGKLDTVTTFDHYHGIQVIGDNNEIVDSISYDNRYGIEVRGTNNLISGNSVYDNQNDGIKLSSYGNNTIDSNSAWFNDVGISLVGEGNDNVTNNLIHDNTAVGISFYLSSDSLAANNTVYKNGNGISSNSNNNEYNGNEIYDNLATGIYISGRDNIIKDNEIRNNTNNGIYVNEYNNISNNIITKNQNNGISVEGDNNIFNNTITRNGNNGLYISDGGNIIFENKFLNNSQIGVLVTTWSSTFYNNTFLINNINAMDNGSSSAWDLNGVGNYWDDYLGDDLNDDGIGDSPYNISGSAGSQDNYPIWEDGDDVPPDILINSPSINQAFGTEAPEFNITINDPLFNAIWYTIDAGLTNFTFTGFSGTINQSAWDLKESGYITLSFYANDSVGNVGVQEINVIKDTVAPIIIINSPIPYQLCGITAPTFSLSIEELTLNQKWYSFNGGENISFTTETQFSQNEWNKYGDGTVLIRFFATDNMGYMNSSEVIVRKDAIIPNISISTPSENEKFGRDSPTFSISIIEEHLDSTWYTLEGVYTLDGDVGNYHFTGLTGTIDQEVWDYMLPGEITIIFFAQDSAGNIGSKSIEVIKSLPSTIPGYNLIILLGVISLLSIFVSIKIKRSK